MGLSPEGLKEDFMVTVCTIASLFVLPAAPGPPGRCHDLCVDGLQL